MLRLAVTLLIVPTLLIGSAGRAQVVDAMDSDHDGLSDGLEMRLIEQFRPVWMVSEHDCSNVPARFVPGLATPQVNAEDGTIYAQARPLNAGNVEVHYYHLWRRDCGEMGHALDTEHVSVLLRAEGLSWKATAWYAAAHEDTLCDAGQLTRASTIDAVDHGAQVWISAGKHASYFAERLCNYGCGGDRCEHMKQLPVGELINLGEAAQPSVAWAASAQWPLMAKMRRTDFGTTRMARLERLPNTDIAWATPEKRPAQSAILGANAGLAGAATGGRAANTAMVIATDNTGNALGAAAVKTKGALGSAAGRTGGALREVYQGARRGMNKVFEAGKASPTK